MSLYVSNLDHLLDKNNIHTWVCGHIHKAEIRQIDGLLYCNDGDWVESLTALVETNTGELKIIHWPKIKGDPVLSLDQTLEPISTLPNEVFA